MACDVGGDVKEVMVRLGGVGGEPFPVRSPHCNPLRTGLC
jgi:hypothetical protein